MNRAFYFAFVLFSITAESVCGQFIDASSNLGVNNINEGTLFGNGISFCDFDHDGWDDLTIANGNDAPLFFKNVFGDFQLISTGIANPQDKQVIMLLWADYDNDEDRDLLITKDNDILELWNNNGEMNFTNVAATAGLEQSAYDYWGAAWADYDHDGWLDLFISKYYLPTIDPEPEFRCLLYHNNGDGTFTESSLAAGIDLPPRPVFQPVFLDYNNDGWEDLYLVIDRIQYQNELFRNNGDGTFSNVSEETGSNIMINSMCGAIADYDHNDYLDIYVTNYPVGNYLMNNNGDGTFTNLADETGVEVNQVCWGSLFLDYDNDSWEDLFVAVTSPYLIPTGNQYYRNNEGTGFTQIDEQLGLSSDLSQTYVMAMGDINNDGYLDFSLNNIPPYSTKLWMNDGGNNHYFSCSLKGTFSNRDAVGSRLECFAGGNKTIREVRAGDNYASQNSFRNVFGLGSINSIDSLVIHWNRGLVETYYDLPVDEHIEFVEGASLDVPYDIVYSGNTWLCPGDSIILDGGEYETYTWTNGDTSRFIVTYTSGLFFVTVNDIYGNEITSNPLLIEVVPQAEVLVNLNHVSCYAAADGSVEVSLQEGEIQEIFWTNATDSTSISGLSPGNYSYNLFYGSGCEMVGEVVITQPDSIMIEAIQQDAKCYGSKTGSVELITSGGVPEYIQMWGEINPDSLYAGSYEIEVVDATGCSGIIGFEIDQPEPLDAVLNLLHQFENGPLGSASVEITGGTIPYLITWSNGVEGAEVINLQEGDYEVTIVDGNNCSLNIEFHIDWVAGLIEQDNQEWTIVPNPASDHLTISGCTSKLVEVKIFSSDGKLCAEFPSFVCGSQIYLGHLDVGVYSLVFYTDSNWIYRKVVICNESE